MSCKGINKKQHSFDGVIRVFRRPYLHFPHSHAVLREHSQGRVPPPRPHHIHGQAAVLKLLFGLQEWVTVQPNVGLQIEMRV